MQPLDRLRDQLANQEMAGPNAEYNARLAQQFIPSCLKCREQLPPNAFYCPKCGAETRLNLDSQAARNSQ